MCSLFGWLDYQGIVPDKFKKKLTQALANAAEERGTDLRSNFCWIMATPATRSRKCLMTMTCSRKRLMR